MTRIHLSSVARQPLLSAALWMTLFACLCVAVPARILGQSQRPQGTVLFMFEDAGAESTDPYVEKVMSVAMEMLRESLQRGGDFGWVEYVRDPMGELDMYTMAKDRDARFLVRGTFEQLKDNVVMTALWEDFDTGIKGRLLRGVSSGQLNDFDLLAERMADLAEAIQTDLQNQTNRLNTESHEQATVLVACFSGVEGTSLSFLGRFITLELPQHLSKWMALEGISGQRVAVSGLSFDAYAERCEGTKRAESSAQQVRYEVSGTIIPVRETVVAIEALMYDFQGKRAVSVGNLTADLEGVREIPRRLAERLAPRLKVILAQMRLNENGVGPPIAVSGELDEETIATIRKVQESKDLEPTGNLNYQVLFGLGLSN